MRALEHIKKNRVRFEQIQQAPFCLKEEHCVQPCPGVHSEHSLMDTRVGPIEHSQMDPGKQGRRSTVSNSVTVHSEHSLMDTRVGPIDHSQMDPTEGSRSTKNTTVAHISKLFPASGRFVVCQIGNLGQWSNFTLYRLSITKWRRQRRNATENKDIGSRKPRESAEKNQTRRKRGDEHSIRRKRKCWLTWTWLLTRRL